MGNPLDPAQRLINRGAQEAVASLIPMPDIPAPPAPPTVTPVSPSAPLPTKAAAEDRARVAREQMDATRRKRGRASSVVTGPEGVGATPVGVKSLVGS
jgi:hypothetical protein